MFFFSWEARNGGIILTREPEIIIVTYIYVPWAPRHICCDVYIRPVGFKGLIIFIYKSHFKKDVFKLGVFRQYRNKNYFKKGRCGTELS